MKRAMKSPNVLFTLTHIRLHQHTGAQIGGTELHISVYTFEVVRGCYIEQPRTCSRLLEVGGRTTLNTFEVVRSRGSNNTLHSTPCFSMFEDVRCSILNDEHHIFARLPVGSPQSVP